MSCISNLIVRNILVEKWCFTDDTSACLWCSAKSPIDDPPSPEGATRQSTSVSWHAGSRCSGRKMLKKRRRPTSGHRSLSVCGALRTKWNLKTQWLIFFVARPEDGRRFSTPEGDHIILDGFSFTPVQVQNFLVEISERVSRWAASCILEIFL